MKNLSIITAASSLIILSGCASSPEQVSTGIQDYEAELAARDAELRQRETEITELRKQIAGGGAPQVQASTDAQASKHSSANASLGIDDLLPPNAKPGQCFARVYTPPSYKTESEQVLKSDGYDVVEVIPAVYGTEEKTVLVKEATEELVVVPAVYGWEEERVLVSPALTELQRVPAKYDFVEDRVLVKPAHSIWKKGSGPITKVDQSTGEIMCLVEVPAVYETVKKRVLVSAETTKEVVVKDAVYKTVKKRVVKEPAKTVTKKIPAVYDAIKVNKLVTAASTKTKAIPPVYETVEKRLKVADGYLEWAPILCETNVTGDIIRKLQRSLNDKQYNAGPIDGVYGWQTTQAVRKYQRDNGLSGNGELTIAVIDKLGIQY